MSMPRRRAGWGPRSRLVIALLALVLFWLPCATGPGTVIAQGGDEPLQDLAAMPLFPLDMEAAGIPGYGFVYPGDYAGRDNLVGFIRGPRGDQDADQINAVLDEAGERRTYASRMEVPEDPTDDFSPAAGVAWTVIVELDEVSGATRLYDYLADEDLFTDGSGAVALPDTGQPGDAASLRALESDEREENRQPYRSVVLTMRTGNLVVQFTFSRPPEILPAKVNDPTDAEVVTGLGQRILDRIDAVRQGDGPGLAQLPIRVARGSGAVITDDDVVRPGPLHESYRAIDGVPFRTYPIQAEESYGAEVAAFRERQVETTFSAYQSLFRGGSEVGRISILVDRLTDEEAATAEFVRIGEEQSDLDGVEVIRDAPTFGDESMTVFSNDAPVFSVLLRVGANLFRIDLTPLGSPPVDPYPIEAVFALAEAQAACLDAGTCYQPIELPSELISLTDGAV